MTELKKEISSLAELQFSSEEISIITGIPEKELENKYKNEVMRGRLIAEAEVRKSILKAAKEGNTAAQ